MALTPAYGVDASVTLPSGIGFMANAFSYNLSQSYAEVVRFGVVDAAGKGAVRRVNGIISGITSYGAANQFPGHSAITQASQALTLTFATGCFFIFNAVFTALSLNVALEQATGTVLGFTRDGTTTEVWASP
jgi:hypothetical protein